MSAYKADMGRRTVSIISAASDPKQKISSGRVGKRREDASAASSKSGAPLPTRFMCIDAWAKSRASDVRRRYAGDFAHPTH